MSSGLVPLAGLVRVRSDAMKPLAIFLFTALLALLLTGCGMGIIYTHTVRPLTPDAHKTPLVTTEKEGGIKHLVLFSGPLSVAWDSNAIGDIARKNGLNEIFFADLETLRVLGVWNQYTVHVYGK
jgi:hypothetical protein